MSDELEYAISQYLDGTLAADAVAELEARLRGDAVARELLEEYRRLDDVLKKSEAVPVLQWDRLAEHLSDAVAAEVEQTEYAAVAFVDGALGADEAAAFGVRLVEDARVAELVEGHRRLRAALRALPTPAVRWDQLAGHLYDAATGAVRSYKISAFRWVRIAGGIAVAACVAVVASVGMRQHSKPVSDAPQTVARAMPSKMEIQIGGMERVAEVAKPRTAEIVIGAGVDRPDAGANSEFAEGIVVAGSPRSLIATNAPVAQDAQMPY